jgi:parvulin-like peptidyl-prolyl isomerase
MPKPKAPTREEIKDRVRAKVAAEKALPASEQIANTLHAVRSTPEAQRLLAELRAEIEREVRWQIAADFETFGRKQDSLSWGEAHLIAREGLCRCRGGSKPCDAEDIRNLVEGGAR